MSLFPIFNNNHLHGHFSMDMIMDPFQDARHVSAPHLPFHHPPSGWNETAEGHVLRVEVPGLKKEEVKVKVREGKVLKISGKRRVEREENGENWHHSERSVGKFSKVLTLPENSRGDHVRSSFDNGVVTITVPKRDHHVNDDVVKNIQVKG